MNTKVANIKSSFLIYAEAGVTPDAAFVQMDHLKADKNNFILLFWLKYAEVNGNHVLKLIGDDLIGNQIYRFKILERFGLMNLLKSMIRLANDSERGQKIMNL
ncbi:hypothetical protein CCR75_000020 [Bremia lactucae]|uniref:Uncharacterized protein n=1 Tax=Bremia lactucae TaxID=4779 RepID=A0A976IKR1_BRELC|nr:hypothetical protein CCR75_000020 [Bremia lactucae]